MDETRVPLDEMQRADLIQLGMITDPISAWHLNPGPNAPGPILVMMVDLVDDDGKDTRTMPIAVPAVVAAQVAGQLRYLHEQMNAKERLDYAIMMRKTYNKCVEREGGR